MKQLIVEDSLLLLEEPLTQYTNSVLLQFIKSKMDKVPKVAPRKNKYISIIRLHLHEFIVSAEVA
jgi:hypothetical protein